MRSIEQNLSVTIVYYLYNLGGLERFKHFEPLACNKIVLKRPKISSLNSTQFLSLMIVKKLEVYNKFDLGI